MRNRLYYIYTCNYASYLTVKHSLWWLVSLFNFSSPFSFMLWQTMIFLPMSVFLSPGSLWMNRGVWKRNWLRKWSWPKKDWWDKHGVNQVQKLTHLLIHLGASFDQDCVFTAEMILVTGDGATWRCSHWQTGEQSSAAQSWNYGEH